MTRLAGIREFVLSCRTLPILLDSDNQAMNHIQTLAACAAFLLPAWALGQIEQGGTPLHWGEPIQEKVVWETFSALDIAQLEAEDKVTATMKDAPWRFGIEHEVNFNLENSGSWTEEDGLRVWHLGIDAEGATSLSFYLEEFQIPKGGELFVYNADRTEFKGAFNHLSMKEWGGLALGLMEGDQVIMEYREPAGLSNHGQIAISQVVQGYRSLLQREAELDAAKSAAGPFGNSGACNINVNCPEGADWQVEKKAVALIVNGGFAACTGSMVNNTANDGTPYFLTANHCLGNPNTWTYYFNHESSTCSGSTGPTDNSISGGSLLVADGGSDVALIELSSTPPSSWDVEYAGWDASGATPDNATGIHHPSGDVKKICFEEDSPYTSSTGGAAVWWIDAWELGVTEPGSSGSPLFDQNHRIIGQLYGGAAACSGSVNNGAYDFYGRFDVSWGLGVSQYLDPTSSGTTVLDGYPTGFNTDEGCTDPTACNYSPLAIIDNGTCAENDACGVCGGDDSSCGGCTNPEACNYDADATIEDGSCILSGLALTISVGGGSWDSEIGWALESSDGIVVQGNAGSSTVCVAPDCYTFSMTDSYGDGWNGATYTLTDADGNVLASGDLDSAQNGDGSTVGSDLVQFGDADCGLGCTDPTACNYDEGASLDNGTCNFDCIGCTDPTACNYDETATEDDGSCVENDDCGVCGGDNSSCGGCTDSEACNYDSNAIFEDGSCLQNDDCGVCGGDNSSCGGCTNPEACNYDLTAILDDGSCFFADPAFGCDCSSEGGLVAVLSGTQESEATSLIGTGNPVAGVMDITLNFTGQGSAWPGDMAVTVISPEGQCVVFGGYDDAPSCDANLGNYTTVWPDDWTGTASGTYTAAVDLTSAGLSGDGTWSVSVYNGWASGPEVTYDLSFTLNGVCQLGDSVPGCTDSTACNYDEIATTDDGSCEYGQTYYLDSDGDGYGSVESGVTCNGVLPGNGSFQSGDCNDANSTVYPDAPGTGIGLDNDCNGTLDADEEEAVCPEDVNGDGVISVADILAVLAEFGCTTGCEADVDGDGNVIVSDLLSLLAAFGQDC